MQLGALAAVVVLLAGHLRHRPIESPASRFESVALIGGDSGNSPGDSLKGSYTGWDSLNGTRGGGLEGKFPRRKPNRGWFTGRA